MNKLLNKLALLTLGLFIFLALNSMGFAQKKSKGDLTTNAWVLKVIDGAGVKTKTAFIKFDEVKKSAGGNGGCNVFGGSFERNGQQIKISEVAATMMFCDAASEIEKKFLDNLNRVTRYKVRGGKLYLYAGDKPVLEFAPKK